MISLRNYAASALEYASFMMQATPAEREIRRLLDRIENHLDALTAAMEKDNDPQTRSHMAATEVLRSHCEITEEDLYSFMARFKDGQLTEDERANGPLMEACATLRDTTASPNLRLKMYLQHYELFDYYATAYDALLYDGLAVSSETLGEHILGLAESRVAAIDIVEQLPAPQTPAQQKLRDQSLHLLTDMGKHAHKHAGDLQYLYSFLEQNEKLEYMQNQAADVGVAILQAFAALLAELPEETRVSFTARAKPYPFLFQHGATAIPLAGSTLEAIHASLTAYAAEHAEVEIKNPLALAHYVHASLSGDIYPAYDKDSYALLKTLLQESGNPRIQAIVAELENVSAIFIELGDHGVRYSTGQPEATPEHARRFRSQISMLRSVPNENLRQEHPLWHTGQHELTRPAYDAIYAFVMDTDIAPILRNIETMTPMLTIDTLDPSHVAHGRA
ncbi:MAG: hypothetical protein J0L97_05830 [Alphaproteobacteria bacterium]|nr:hypothetical protein [Alphaproteobacteria bacterium]